MTTGITFTFFENIPSSQLLYPLITTANMLYWYVLSCLIIWVVSYKPRRKPKRKLGLKKRRERLEHVVRYTLRVLLVLNFLCLVFISFTNPESYLFGQKLAGMDAIIYLLTGGIAGLLIAHLLFKKKSEGEILSLLYFGYFFVENLITNLSLEFGFFISPLFTAGLIVSIVLLVVRRLNARIR